MKLSTFRLTGLGGARPFYWLFLSTLIVVCINLPTSLSAKSHDLTNAENPIVLENKLDGDPTWEITKASNNNEIAGYASATSINKGDAIDLFISSTSSEYTLKVYRMGWYGGDGARLLAGPITLNGETQAVSSPDPNTKLVDLDWEKSYELETDSDWVTGSYLVKLTNLDGNHQAYIPFTVRDDDRPADIAFQNSVTTWQAYNNFGGESLYDHRSSNGIQAFKVSFNRPYAVDQDFGAGQFLRWEYQMIRFLEREGYDVTYLTNIDTHTSLEQLKQHQSFLSVGHDEYWSWEMRNNVEELRANGIDLGFFTANAAYWQIRYENSPETGDPNRVMVGYRYKALAQDPIFKDGDSSNDYLSTGQFRHSPTNRPEESLIGVMYGLFPVINEDMIIPDTDHWTFNNTGLNNGDTIVGVLGYEVDGIYGYGPDNLEILGATPLKHPDNPSRDLTAYMTIYETGFDSYVFATGTIQWSWGLDNYSRLYAAEHNFRSFAAEQVTRNVLDKFINHPEPPVTETPTATLTPTFIPTATATNTPVATATSTATQTPLPTSTTVATVTQTPSPTLTLEPTQEVTPILIIPKWYLYLPLMNSNGNEINSDY